MLVQDLLIFIWPVLKIVLEILVVVISLLLIAAYYVYVERKILAWIMLRKGPNVVGSFGLLQPIADGIKLITKEVIMPLGANKVLFLIAPLITFVCSLLSWAVIPFNYGWVIANINVGVLYIFAISSLGVYGIIIAGWSSNSRYAFLGSLRAAAQMISYEVSMGFVLVTVLLCAGSLNLTDIVLSQQHFWFFIPLFPMFIVFFVSALAETNRTPFDLPEAEAELVAGYVVEYSSSIFLLFMVGEYINMILMSALTSILFFGGWLSPAHCLDCIPGFVWFVIKTSIFMFIFIWVRGTLPRYRYDQLMRLGWKVFLPLSLIWLCVVAGFIYSTGFSFNR